ncbi:MAG TPA: Jag N-terminal domain-containing protein [Actinomycetota bacterium]|nr:Jag N-terminal domain-containing protein [Actinomycetota bacterium]
MPWIEKDGRNVDEARAAALSELGLPEDVVEIEVVHEGARGLFGLGGEPAVVRVRPRTEAPDFRSAFEAPGPAQVDPPPGSDDQEADLAPPPAVERQGPVDGRDADVAPATEDPPAASEDQEMTAQVGREMVEGILGRMGLDGQVATRVSGGTVYIEISGENMGILIGRGGATLEALQELVRAGVQRRLKARGSVVVDVEAYWERRRSRSGRPSEGKRRQSGRRSSDGGRRGE